MVENKKGTLFRVPFFMLKEKIISHSRLNAW